MHFLFAEHQSSFLKEPKKNLGLWFIYSYNLVLWNCVASYLRNTDSGKVSACVQGESESTKPGKEVKGVDHG